MDLIFEQGNQEQPKGHAILYYRSGNEVLSTYLVVLPLSVDFTKYIPPVLASQVKSSGIEEFSAFAIPPVPEEAQSYHFLERLATLRGDDLIFGGELRNKDFLEAAQQVNDAIHAYARLYQSKSEVAQGTDAVGPSPAGLSMEEVLFPLLSDKDKVRELAKLVGKLQFAVEGNDTSLIKETEKEIRTIGGYLPQNYHLARLIETAKGSPKHGSRLAQLYLERCYKLADEDYLGLQEVERAIREVQDTAS